MREATETKRVRCDWSELFTDECAHCCPNREFEPLVKSEDELAIEELRAEVMQAIHDRTTKVLFPLPIDRTRKPNIHPKSTPRWNPGNVAAQIGSDLTAIEDMFSALQEEAENRHSDREMPGGDALVMLGPGADVEAFGYVQISALVGRIPEEDVVLPDRHDIEPPLSFLASWEDIIREEREQPVWLNATIKRSAGYIRESIDWMLSLDENGEARFLAVDDLANGLAIVRRRMEDILRDGTRAEFTRVKCISPECETHPRLMKLWAAQVRWDRYRCPECRTEYNAKQYELAKAQNMHDRGVEKFISPRESADASEVPIKTVYSWMKRRKAERRWIVPMDGNPYAVVWWPDVRDLAIERRVRLDRQAVRRAIRKVEKEAEKEAEAKRKAEAAASDTDEDMPEAKAS